MRGVSRYTKTEGNVLSDRKDRMKKFASVREAVEWIDVPATHTKIKNAGGMAHFTKQGAELSDAEENASGLLRFIESGDLKRELERQLAEHGEIDLTIPDGESLTLLGDYFDSMIVLKQSVRVMGGSSGAAR
jgi:hypothetical protein